MKEITVICDCHWRKHQLSICYDPDDRDFLYFTMHLSAVGFFRRVWVAVKYVLGYRSKYGDWDEVLVGSEEALRIKTFIEGYLYQVTPEQAATMYDDTFVEAMNKEEPND